MNKILSLVVALPGMLFVLIGLRWLIDPPAAAAQLGMPLLDGLGRSAQIGGLSGFFLTLGLVILIGIITSRRHWFYPAIMLLGITATGRMLAWAVHDAPLAIDMIAVEVIVACLLAGASRFMAVERGAPHVN